MKRNYNHILLTEQEVLQAITEYIAKNSLEFLRGFTAIYSESNTPKLKDSVVLNAAPVTVDDIHYNYSLRLDMDEVTYIPVLDTDLRYLPPVDLATSMDDDEPPEPEAA